MELRAYQRRVIDAVESTNAIVKMPTGSGKTIVAAVLIQRKLESSSDTRRILFLVPTRELVSQQAAVVSKWCEKVEIAQYYGGLRPPSAQHRVIVSTPAAFRMLQANDSPGFSWGTFSLVIYDEVHHVLKDHPYRHIAKGLLNWHGRSGESEQKVQTLGLSASLTYDVKDAKIRATLDRLCRELAIGTMISPSVEELQAGGYVPQHGKNVEVLSSTRDVPEGVLPEESRLPHLLHASFMKRIQNGTATEFALDVMKVVELLEGEGTALVPSFHSPLSKAKLSSWEDAAHKLATSSDRATSAVQQRELFAVLESWYVALRVLVQTWEEEVQTVLQWLKMTEAVTRLPPSLQQQASVQRVTARMENEHNLSKLGELHGQIVAKKALYGADFQCLVFVQQRFTAMVLSHFLNECDSSLQAGFVASRNSSVTPSIKVTPSNVQSTISAFRAGDSSVLVATSVVEEGFDVPEANVVILYDHMKDSVELCQRFGRARATHCSIVVMEERSDRPLSFLETVREGQDRLVQSYNASALGAVDPAVEKKKLKDRERSAFRVLADTVKCRRSPLLVLNEYVKKTRALLAESTAVCATRGGWVCRLTYSTALRELVVSASMDTKKAAKLSCCQQLLSQLRDQTRP